MVTIGIVANEFFDPVLGRMGGFGRLARSAAETFQAEPEGRMRPLFLTGELTGAPGERETWSNGIRLIFHSPDWPRYVRDLQEQHVDLLLTVDYRPDYDWVLAALPDVPLIVWVQDPRPAGDAREIDSLRIPLQEDRAPQGIAPVDTRGLKLVVDMSERSHRPVHVASPVPELVGKIEGAYGMKVTEVGFLPYPLDPPARNADRIVKSERPRVVFLGRLDPIKRPWIFLELARHFPGVEFLFLGKSHFTGPGAWQPETVPDNVRFMGHVDGEEKVELLSSAWALVNTSIHESLPVSFLEALQYETPILSCQDLERISSRFGVYTGAWEGTGLEGMPSFIEGLARLVDDREFRTRVGREGRGWVGENHTRSRFLSAFQTLATAIIGGRRAYAPGSDEQRGGIPEPWGVAAWGYHVYATTRDLASTVPPGQRYILVDDGQLGGDAGRDELAVPFLERDGQYWGPPPDDETAIRELERLRRAGVGYIAFASPAFWWLSHYANFTAYLHSHYLCILQNERLVVFDIAAPGETLTSS